MVAPWSNKVFVIAEVGVNHNGSMDIAKKLIKIAKETGCDAVKFQSFKTEELVTANAKKAEYQIKNLSESKTDTQFDMLKKLEINEAQHDELIDYCKNENILFMSTAFDFESLKFLKSKNIKIFKNASGEITNYPLLKKYPLDSFLIISTGNCNESEIKETRDFLFENGFPKENVCFLHCTSEYPAPYHDINLNVLPKLKNNLGTAIGYSDHSLGIEVSVAAVALGARVIEKHITLDKTMVGPDHRASIDASELKAMVSSIRNIEKALGADVKVPTPSEAKNKKLIRKAIYAKGDIRKGDILTEQNITVKRPEEGLSAKCWFEVVGQKATKDYKKDEPIEKA